MDFEREAYAIIAQLSSVSPDIAAEKKELREITIKINNGVKAVLNGLVMPELQEEIDRLRVRKSELEDIISNVESKTGKVGRDKLIAYMKKTAEELETDPAAAKRAGKNIRPC